MHCGESKERGGRVGEDAAYGLSDDLLRLGFERGRLKTGTPPRVEASTIDFSETTLQPGDDPPVPFAHSSRGVPLRQIPCHIAYTNEATHDVIRANLHRAPMYSGDIEGIGPRYCPSIEGQGRPVRIEGPSPDLSRARGPRHIVGVSERQSRRVSRETRSTRSSRRFRRSGGRRSCSTGTRSSTTFFPRRRSVRRSRRDSSTASTSPDRSAGRVGTRKRPRRDCSPE